MGLPKRHLSDQKLQIDALDGLRGLAVFIVFLSHSSNRGWHLIPGIDFYGTGKSGVFLFFLLSAFLLSRNLCRKPGPFFTRQKATSYWLRRILRIYPLYLLYLSLAVLNHYYGSAEHSFEPKMPPELALDHALLQAGVSISWSIPVEFKYYVILPFIAWGLGKLLNVNWILAACMAIVSIAIVNVAFPPQDAVVNDIRTAPYLAIFIIGSYLGVLHSRDTAVSPKVKAASLVLLPMALCALVYATPLFQSWLSGERVAGNLTHRWFIYYGLAWGGLLVSCLYGYRWIGKIFEFPPLKFLGLISFGFYLWHQTMIHLTRIYFPEVDPTLKAWIAFTAALGVSVITYYLIEAPMSRIGSSRKTEG